MTRYFTLDEARALLPEARERIGEVAALVVDLQRLQQALQRGGQSELGGIPEAKALEARVDEALQWFTTAGIQVKGIAPALLDFPARTPDGDVLLCWLQGEPELAWYHPLETGFLGRAPIAQLDLPG